MNANKVCIICGDIVVSGPGFVCECCMKDQVFLDDLVDSIFFEDDKDKPIED